MKLLTGLHNILGRCINLQRLEVGFNGLYHALQPPTIFCRHLTHVNFNVTMYPFLEQILRTSPKLTHLYAIGSTMDDSCVAALTETCPDVEVLEVATSEVNFLRKFMNIDFYFFPIFLIKYIPGDRCWNYDDEISHETKSRLFDIITR